MKGRDSWKKRKRQHEKPTRRKVTFSLYLSFNMAGTKAKPATADKKKSPDTKKKRGWDEIACLFDDGKKKKQEEREKQQQVAQQKKKKKKPHMPPAAVRAGGEWVDDGLGGVYNSEGFTGRVEDGVKIFKAHILSKEGAGETPDCPFDCKCCFI